MVPRPAFWAVLSCRSPSPAPPLRLRLLRVPLFCFLLSFSAFCDDLATFCKSQFECDFVGGMVCSMGLCVPTKCHLSSECPIGWACNSEMQCRKSCFSDEDCALIGWFCSAQFGCVQGDCSECRVGEKCVEGQCIPRWVRGMDGP